ncbi:uncharacterized protein LAESUDRAFT_727079 [Laetiporus sulphureus 93-53]|uniref:Peptidase C14 caspase domain-containing protein n=1 Tax=Laetiporus sulphureus 93-53 TaxID=1314785 RepID=A0A165DQW9_9APHY|nr:uncharacterized protein LAESUDRAFT_727079 [Laetiporus sulphureus 93-53]KZT05434.1 hypothetical protein LAESUDRAFT_727079 [Laetiporus sulphureus 93-53]
MQPYAHEPNFPVTSPSGHPHPLPSGIPDTTSVPLASSSSISSSSVTCSPFFSRKRGVQAAAKRRDAFLARLRRAKAIVSKLFHRLLPKPPAKPSAKEAQIGKEPVSPTVPQSDSGVDHFPVENSSTVPSSNTLTDTSYQPTSTQTNVDLLESKEAQIGKETVSPTVSQSDSGVDHSPVEKSPTVSGPNTLTDTSYQPTSTQTKNSGTQTFALIIAIDDYKGRPLRGCVNDGEAMYQYLRTKLSVPSSNTLFLKNGQATAGAIERGFREHLIMNPRIQTDDLILFFFAGHGTSEYAHTDWPEEYRGDMECICPQDMDFTAVHGIPSIKLNAWFAELASRKGQNVVAIFDCCHSGKMSRNMIPSPAHRLYLPPDHAKLPFTLDSDSLKWVSEESSRKAGAIRPTCFAYDALASHILLSACKQDELAQETMVEDASGYEGRNIPAERAVEIPKTKALPQEALDKPRSIYRGHFSKVLIDKLCSIQPGSPSESTYRELIDTLHPLSGSQHPQCGGANQHRIVWSVFSRDDATCGYDIEVAPEADQLIVAAGKIVGVREGMKFDIDPGDGSKALQGFKITEVRQLQSVSDACASAQYSMDYIRDKVTRRARAVFIAWKLTRLNVFCEKQAEEILGEDQAFLREQTISLMKKSAADIGIDYDTGSKRWILERLAPRMSKYAKQKTPFNAAAGELWKICRSIARFNHHLLPSITPLSNITLELHHLKRVDGPFGTYFDSERKIELDRRHEEQVLGEFVVYEDEFSSDESYYGVNITNNTNYDLFPYLFYFDPNDYSITQFYLSEEKMDPPLKRHSSFQIGYGKRWTSRDAIQLTLTDGMSESAFLKLYVSTVWVKMDDLPQHSPLSSIGRGAQVVKLPVEEMWGACSYVLTTCQNKLAKL